MYYVYHVGGQSLEWSLFNIANWKYNLIIQDLVLSRIIPKSVFSFLSRREDS